MSCGGGGGSGGGGPGDAEEEERPWPFAEEEEVFRGNKLYPNVPSVSSSGSLGLQRSHPPILLMALNLTQANALKCTRTPISYILYVL